MKYRQFLTHTLAMLVYRSGPQDLPASLQLLILAVVGSGTISLVGLGQLGAPGNLPLQVAVAAAFSLVFVRVALVFRGGASRFLQTATAMFATDAFLTIIALPAAAGLDPATQEASALASTWLLVVLLWSVGVLGHIFRHALNLPLAGGILVALLYLFLSLNLSAMLT